MSAAVINLITVLIVLLAIGGTIFYFYHRISKKVKDLSREFLGTENPVEGFRKIEAESAVTPKTVSSATGLYLPQIQRDFPDFHFDEMKQRAENVLVSYLQAIDRDSVGVLKEGTDQLKDQLHLELENYRGRGEKCHYQNIRVHRTEISKYVKGKGRCSVIFQSAVQFLRFVEDKNGEVVKGSKTVTHQGRYNVEVMYIQDADQIENLRDAGLALNCPNCGGPLQSLGAKKCIYCDSPIMEFNIKVWNFCDVKEIS